MSPTVLRGLILAGNLLLLGATGLCSYIFFFLPPPTGRTIVAVSPGDFRPRIALSNRGILDKRTYDVIGRAMDQVARPPTREPGVNPLVEDPRGGTPAGGSRAVPGGASSGTLVGLQQKVRPEWVVFDPDDPGRCSAMLTLLQGGREMAHRGVGEAVGEGTLNFRLKRIEPKERDDGIIRSYRLVFEDEEGRQDEIEYRVE